MPGIDSSVSTTISPGIGVLGSVADALSSLERQGWHVITGVHQPGRPTAGVDAVLVGPGGVLVLEAGTTHRRLQSVLSAVTAAVVALVPADTRRHVQSVVCPPAERSDSDAVAVKPGVLAAFVRSLPQVLNPESAAAIASRLTESLTGSAVIDLWTANKVLEWTKNARGDESSNRAARRGRSPRSSGRVVGWLSRHALLLSLSAIVLVLLATLGQ